MADKLTKRFKFKLMAAAVAGAEESRWPAASEAADQIATWHYGEVYDGDTENYLC